MWHTELTPSAKQYYLVSLLYSLLLIAAIYSFIDTIFDNVTFIIVIVLVIEWWRACCYFKTIRGELALFYEQNQLYWSRQRWTITNTIFFRYAVIVHLVSQRNAKKRVLFLMDDSLSCEDWRSLNYFLRFNNSLQQKNSE